MIKLSFKILSLIIFLLNTSYLYAFEEVGKGTVSISAVTTFERNKELIIIDATKIACKDALKKYVSTFTIDKKKNYDKIKSKIENDYLNYMVCDKIIDQNLDVAARKFTILVKADIDETKINQALIESSAIALTSLTICCLSSNLSVMPPPKMRTQKIVTSKKITVTVYTGH